MTMRRFILSSIVAAAAFAAAPALAQPATALPPGDGRDIVAIACTYAAVAWRSSGTCDATCSST